MAAAASTAREAREPLCARLPPAEAEPWGDEGGGLEAPAARPTWLRRARERIENSVWAPVALKLLGLVVGMLALSGVGIASLLSGSSGVQVSLASMLGANVRAPSLPVESKVLSRTPGPVAGASASASASPSASVLSPSSAALSISGSPAQTAGDATAGVDSAAPVGKSSGMSAEGKVILNLANADELRHLPGIGQKRADAILALRSRLGRFKQINDLLRVKGIGMRGLRRLVPHVILDAARPAA